MSCARPSVLVVLLSLLASGGCQKPQSVAPVPTSRAERLDEALSKAGQFLAKQQGKDGAWRSDFYGPFKDGGSLTPLVLLALQGVPPTPDTDAAASRGAAFLAAMAKPDGTIDEGIHGLSYPVYTAAMAVRVLSQPAHAAHRSARDAWLTYLRQRQLTESLGWDPTDKPYGGWGFCAVLPRKPKPGEGGPPMLESNLSATVFALEALRAAGCPATDPAFARALVFVSRCQNFGDVPKWCAPNFDDGGFFFIYDDPVRNKAGVAGAETDGRERFHSYGSTTADGLRGLLLCGLPTTDLRVQAARGWLETHFTVTSHPGTYASNREAERESVYYYYCASAAQALRALKVDEVRTPTGPIRWVEALTDELLKRQKRDGTWANPSVPQREDDPLVATSEVLLALAAARSAGEAGILRK